MSTIKIKKGKNMYLKDFLTRFSILPTYMARAMKTYHNVIFRIIRDGRFPSLTVALKIEDFTEGKVTPRDIYNECISIKEINKKKYDENKKKNRTKSNK
jgi:hypothetical protein